MAEPQMRLDETIDKVAAKFGKNLIRRAGPLGDESDPDD